MTKNRTSKKHSLARGTQHRAKQKIKAALALAAALAPLTLSAASARADGTGSYENVANALQGQTYLLRSDDLLLSMGGEDPDLSGVRDSWLGVVSNDDYGFPSEGIAQSNDTIECGRLDIHSTQNCEWWYPAWDNESRPVSGRFFNTDTDAVVQVTNISRNLYTIPVGIASHDIVTLVAGTDADGNAIPTYAARQALPFTPNATTDSRPVVADWDGDGLDEIALVYSDSAGNYTSNARLRFVTPANRSSASAGWTFGPEFGNDQIGINYQIHAAVAADVNGDGRPELVLLYVNNDTLDLTLAIYSVSSDLTPTFQSSVVVDHLAQTAPNEAMDLAVGSFLIGSNAQQVAVVSRNGYENYNAVLRLYDCGGGYTPTKKSEMDTNFALNRLRLQAGRFTWGDSTDSLAVMLTNVSGNKSSTQVRMINVDPNDGSLTQAVTIDPIPDLYGNDQSYVVLDIAVGNFNNHYTAEDGTPLGRNPDLQVAILTAQNQGAYNGNPTAPPFTYRLDQVAYYNFFRDDNGALALEQGPFLPTLTDGQDNQPKTVTGASLVPSDLHGRSLKLGNGQKIEISRQAATMILAQPPMHVDWAKETLNGDKTLLNLSYAPEKFAATYTTSSSSSSSVQNTQSKGWGFSGKESLSGQLSEAMGDGLLVEKIQVSDTITAQQEINHNTDHKYGTVTSTEDTTTATTGSNDEVWFEESTSYVYVYDVVGKTICPDAETSCADADRIPLTVMFSAPGSSSTTHAGGEALEWYQPPWENGNILSYAGNQAQLLASVSRPQVLSSNNQFGTTNDDSTWSVKWSVTSSDETDVTSNSVFKLSNDFNEQLSGKIGPVGYEATVDFDIGGSASFGSLRASSTTSSQAQGVSLTKDLAFKTSSNVAYNFTPVIYGESQPQSYADVQSNDQAVNVFGPLRTGYWVDLTSSNAPIRGFIGQNYADFPDLALNHPNRLGYYKPASQDGLPSNCVEGTEDGYTGCASLNARTPDDPWNDSFHNMRGFFVSRINPVTKQAGAPQATMTAGDQMQLSARVYNYSTVDTPSNGKIYVDFYAMRWDSAHQRPYDYVDASNPGGASTWIATTTLDSIPHFSATGSTQNYALASVGFDTTAYADQDLMFWVLVWGQNADGSMMAEPDQKGLSALPTSTPITKLLDAAALEPLMANSWKTNDKDPDDTSFSNNIGVYRQVFSVLPSPVGGTQGLLGAGAAKVVKAAKDELAMLSVPNLEAKRATLPLGESTEVHGTIHNNSDAVEVISAYFYDGDPTKGGRLFDVDRYPYVRAGADYLASTQFTPRTCGDHEVYLQLVHKGVKSAAAQPVDKVTVTCAGENSGKHDGGGCSVGSHGTSSAWGWLLGLFGLGLNASLNRRRAKKASAR